MVDKYYSKRKANLGNFSILVYAIAILKDARTETNIVKSLNQCIVEKSVDALKFLLDQCDIDIWREVTKLLNETAQQALLSIVPEAELSSAYPGLFPVKVARLVSEHADFVDQIPFALKQLIKEAQVLEAPKRIGKEGSFA